MPFIPSYSYFRSFGSPRFKITIDTSKDTGDSFTLPLRSGFNYNFTVYWGDGNSSVITAWDDLDKSHTYASGGVYQVEMDGDLEAWYFNNGTDALKLTSINNWGDVGFINMDAAFYGCSNFSTLNDLTGGWSSLVTIMRDMLRDCTSFNEPINSWDVSLVTNMDRLFQSSTFNQPLNLWVTSSLTTMASTFALTPFNQPLNLWDVSNVTTATNTFLGSDFNQPLNSWDTSNFITISGIFNNSDFNQPLNLWDITSLTTATAAFANSVFDQDLGDWKPIALTNATVMFANTTLSIANYNSLLTGWSGESLQSNVTLDAPLCYYSGIAAVDRQSIIDDYTWTINDAGTDDVESFVFTANIPASSNQVLGLSNSFNYNFIIDWGDGTSDLITVWNDPNKSHLYTSTDVYTITITGICEAIFFGPFTGWDDKLRTIENWGRTNFKFCAYSYGLNNITLTINDDDGGWCDSVTSMSDMFNGCDTIIGGSFGTWIIPLVEDAEDMFIGITLPTATYNAFLIGLDSQVLQDNVLFGAGSSKYSGAAIAAKASIISTYSWTIVDGGEE